MTKNRDRVQIVQLMRWCLSRSGFVTRIFLCMDRKNSKISSSEEDTDTIIISPSDIPTGGLRGSHAMAKPYVFI